MIKTTSEIVNHLFSAIGSGVFGIILNLLTRENLSMFTGWQMLRFAIVGVMCAVLSYFGTTAYFNDVLYSLLSGVVAGFSGYWVFMGIGKVVQNWGVKPFSTASKIVEIAQNWRKK